MSEMWVAVCMPAVQVLPGRSEQAIKSRVRFRSEIKLPKGKKNLSEVTSSVRIESSAGRGSRTRRAVASSHDESKRRHAF